VHGCSAVHTGLVGPLVTWPYNPVLTAVALTPVALRSAQTETTIKNVFTQRVCPGDAGRNRPHPQGKVRFPTESAS
jgi:hypothetical protein